MKKILIAAFLISVGCLKAHAGGAMLVRQVPNSGPCTIDRKNITTSTSSWVSTYVLQQKMTLTSESTNFFWVGFNQAVTTMTGRGFYTQGFSQDYLLTENTSFYMITIDPVGAKASFTYCR